MRKFTFLYMAILILFIVLGTFFIFFGSKEDSTEIDESLINKTPGLQTALDIEKILKAQQLDQSLIDISVSPSETMQSVFIELQGNDFVTEDVLQKDAYNIYTNAISLEKVNDITIRWVSNIMPNNDEVLLIQMTKDQMMELQQLSYTLIPQHASNYVKNENLK